jgi:hypothetical protein
MKRFIFLITLLLCSCDVEHPWHCSIHDMKRGMSTAEFSILCGKPARINYTMTETMNEQWVYSSLSQQEYAYFENDRLISWQWSNSNE